LGSKNSNSKVQSPSIKASKEKEVAANPQKSFNSQQVSTNPNFINLELYMHSKKIIY
jgi:hypothetical protein